MKDKINFDMESAIQALRAGNDLSGKDGIFTPLIKQLTEAAMQPQVQITMAAPKKQNDAMK